MARTILWIFGCQAEWDVESSPVRSAGADRGQGSSPAAFGVLPGKLTFGVCRELSHGHTATAVDRLSLLIACTATPLV